MSTIRLIDTRTGQPLPLGDSPEAKNARDAARYAGAMHYVHCDLDGFPIRDANGRMQAVGSVSEMSAEGRAELKEALRTDPRNPHQRQFFTGAQDHAAVHAEITAKYGAAAAGPAPDTASPKVGDVQIFPHDHMPDYGPGVTVVRAPQMG